MCWLYTDTKEVVVKLSSFLHVAGYYVEFHFETNFYLHF